MVELSLFLASGLFAIGLGHCLYVFATTANLGMLVWAAAAVLAFRGSLKRNPQVVVAFILFVAIAVASFARK